MLTSFVTALVLAGSPPVIDGETFCYRERGRHDRIICEMREETEEPPILVPTPVPGKGPYDRGCPPWPGHALPQPCRR